MNVQCGRPLFEAFRWSRYTSSMVCKYRKLLNYCILYIYYCLHNLRQSRRRRVASVLTYPNSRWAHCAVDPVRTNASTRHETWRPTCADSYRDKVYYSTSNKHILRGRLNLPATTVRIDKHVWTEINLMSSRLDMMSQIQIGREDGQVTCQGTLMLWQGTFAFPISTTAGSAAAASASAAAAASTAHAAGRCRVLRVAVAAGAFVVRLLLQQFVAVGQLRCLNGSIAVVGLRQWARTTCRCTDCMMLQFWLRMALLRVEKRRGEHTLEVG